MEAACFFHVVKSLVITYKSRGPDQELQRRQRVYRQLGVQQALVLVQFNRNSMSRHQGGAVVPADDETSYEEIRPETHLLVRTEVSRLI